MFAWLKNRLCVRARSRTAPSAHAPRHDDAAQHFATRRQARQLCDAIDRGAQLKLWDHVDRLKESASKLAWFDAPLAQRLAKLEVARGEPEMALAMLGRGVSASGSTRLLRIMCLLLAGARTEAQFALREWMRRWDDEHMRFEALPPDGRMLLALLEWQEGDLELATRLLRDASAERATDDDSARWTQMMLVLLAAAQGQWDRATDRARTLTDSAEGLAEREMAIILDSLRLGAPVDPEKQRQERIEQMARELPTQAHLIEPIVEAQRRSFEAPVAEELADALEKAFGEMGEHQATAAEALAHLHAMLGERRAATTWATRGLALNPMSARLALLLNDLEHAPMAPSHREHAA